LSKPRASDFAKATSRQVRPGLFSAHAFGILPLE
jgi:hypothetical protein